MTLRDQSDPERAARDELERAHIISILLGREELDRRWVFAPDRTTLSFGAGQQPEQTILGNQQHPFYGVCVLNRTAKSVFVGFEAGQGIGSPLICPPFSVLVWPARYVQLSLAVGVEDALGPVAEISVLRLQVPPTAPAIFSYGTASSTSSAAHSQASDIALTNAGSSVVVTANAERRGLEVVVTGEQPARLGLGQAAAVGDGIYLAGGGGSWDGLLSRSLWLGSVNAIAQGAATTIAAVET